MRNITKNSLCDYALRCKVVTKIEELRRAGGQAEGGTAYNLAALAFPAPAGTARPRRKCAPKSNYFDDRTAERLLALTGGAILIEDPQCFT